MALARVKTDGKDIVSLISYEKGYDAVELFYQDESFEDNIKDRFELQKFEGKIKKPFFA